MTLCLEKARRAWVRLPRPLHAALLELREAHPRPVVFSTSQAVRFEPLLTTWRLVETRPVPSDINPAERVDAVALNTLGLAFADKLEPLSNDKRTHTPLMPLADVLAGLPRPVLEWLSTPPPIEKHAGGMLFEALGVLLLDRRGESYYPSRELLMALEELHYRQTGGAFRSDGPVSPVLSADHTAALRSCMSPEGVPWRSGAVDGRVLRPLLDTDGAGLVMLREIDGVQKWVVPHMMRNVAQALIDGESDPFRLITLMPTQYQEWVANRLPIALVPGNPKLLALIGVVKRKGKYDWQLTPLGNDIAGRVSAFLAAYDEGSPVAADDTAYEGDGVEIVLPDMPYQPLDQEFGEADLYVGVRLNIPPVLDLDGDNPWDILGEITGTVPDVDARAFADEGGFHITLPSDTPPEQIAEAFAELMSSGGRVVEAPVPSNAELAAAKARREARHPVADLSLDDEFDIL
ncbi:hypothetical protein LESZY_00920 [Brevundimonas phage vB_BpoS-Leszy]|nr:hypothetical protein LESZY_00920 [Brevundimonas phage vB_BpoS-Leszy]